MDGDIIKISLVARNDAGSAIINTFHYKDLTGGAVAWDPLAVAADWDAVYTPDFIAVHPAAYVIDAIRCDGLAGPSGLLGGDVIPAGANAGTVAGPAQAVEMAISIQRNTGYRGRKERGRIFLAPVPNSMLLTPEEGFVDTANAALIQIAADVVQSQVMGGILWTPVLVSGPSTAVVASKPLLNGIIAPIMVRHISRRTKTFI